MSRAGTPGWRRAEAARLISFGRAAALPDGGFGWLTASGRIDTTQPRPLYATARMTHVFALAHLAGTAGAKPLATSGLQDLPSLPLSPTAATALARLAPGQAGPGGAPA